MVVVLCGSRVVLLLFLCPGSGRGVVWGFVLVTGGAGLYVAGRFVGRFVGVACSVGYRSFGMCYERERSDVRLVRGLSWAVPC